jgi:hypothetical protein
MAVCKDPLRTSLNDKGYNVILLPRQGIEPMDILGKEDKSIERLGTLSQIWSSPATLPAVKSQAATGIAGQKTSELNLDIGLKFLSDVLGAMGAAIPKLDFAFKNSKKVEFSFANVQAVSVDPFVLGSFMTQGTLADTNPFVTRYFFEEDTDAFVITEVLKSNSITVKSVSNNNTGASLDLPAIQQAVGIKVGVSSGNTSNTTLTFTGEPMLTFGYRIFRIEFLNGKWVIRGQKPSGDFAFTLPTGDSAGENGVILDDDPASFVLARAQHVR